MKKTLTLSLLLIVFLISISCSPFYEAGDYFFISRQGAVMPVWVRGNRDSGIFVIANHGGPGETTQYLGKFHAFNELEKQYAVVYWDQRNSGVSQGNPAPESISPENFAEDLQMVVDAISQKYNPDYLFLYGVSWGGTLILQFATDAQRRTIVDGLIVEGGGHDMPLLLETSIARVTAFAQQQIAAQTNTEYWQEALSYLSANSDTGNWDLKAYRTYAQYLQRANAERSYETQRREDEFSGPGGEDIFFSPLSFSMFFSPATLLPNLNILSLDLSAAMNAIDTPVLLLWGEHDINSPAPEMPEAAAAVLPNETYDGVIPDAGHNPVIDNPDEYLSRFTAFIDGITGGL